jgi:hypothetical protein
MGAVQLFNLAEANALIPWLERTMGTQRLRLDRIAALARAISDVTGGGARPTLSPVDGEPARVREMKVELSRDVRALRETSDAIESLGICVTDMRAGSVDFPAFHAGSSIWFCWTPGERRIGFWHAGTECTSERRPIEADLRAH